MVFVFFPHVVPLITMLFQIIQASRWLVDFENMLFCTFQVIILLGCNRHIRRSERSRITCVQPLCSKNYNFNSYYQDLLWISAQCRKIQYKQLIILLLPLRRIILEQINISEFKKKRKICGFMATGAALSADWLSRARSESRSERVQFQSQTGSSSSETAHVNRCPCWSNLFTRRVTVGRNQLGSQYLNGSGFVLCKLLLLLACCGDVWRP